MLMATASNNNIVANAFLFLRGLHDASIEPTARTHRHGLLVPGIKVKPVSVILWCFIVVKIMQSGHAKSC